MRIVILRHGKTGLPAWPRIKSRDLGNWIEAYNRAGIGDALPPRAAVDVARTCKIVVTSDLLRSVESGEVLGSETPMLSAGVFREAGLPYTAVTFFKMPPSVWAVLFRVLWSFGFKTNGESVHLFRKRAQSASTFLISLAKEHGAVLLVGHGLINRYIARELLSAGWRGPRRTKIRHWGFTEYSYED